MIEEIRRELRREGVPVWHFTGRIQVPTPERIFKSLQYISGFAWKLSERLERGYETTIARPIIRTVAPSTSLAPTEQVKRGVVSGVVRTPLALTGIPMLRMGFKGVATPSGLKREIGEISQYVRRRPYEFAAETATSLLVPSLGKLRAREPFEVGIGERLIGRVTRRYIPKERIVPSELKFSTLRMPKTTPTQVMKSLIEKAEFKLTGKAEEVWHAAKFRRFKPSLTGISEVPPGYSPVKGTYVAPTAYPAFASPRAVLVTGAKIPKELRFDFEPHFFSITTKGVKIPKRVRVTPAEITKAEEAIGITRLAEAPYSPKLALKQFAQYKKYVEEKAPKGYAYVTPEVTAKIPWRGKLEVEAIIPVGTKVKEPLTSRLFPKFTEQEMIIAKPTIRGEFALRKFYRQVRKGLKTAKTEEEKQAFLEKIEPAHQKLIGELERKGWLKTRTGTVKIKVRRLRTIADEEESALTKLIGRRRGRRAGRRFEERFEFGREFEIVQRRGRRGRGIAAISPLFFGRRAEAITPRQAKIMLSGREGGIAESVRKTITGPRKWKTPSLISTTAIATPVTRQQITPLTPKEVRIEEPKILRQEGTAISLIFRKLPARTHRTSTTEFFMPLYETRPKKRKKEKVKEKVKPSRFELEADKFLRITPISSPTQLIKTFGRRK